MSQDMYLIPTAQLVDPRFYWGGGGDVFPCIWENRLSFYIMVFLRFVIEEIKTLVLNYCLSVLTIDILRDCLI